MAWHGFNCANTYQPYIFNIIGLLRGFLAIVLFDNYFQRKIIDCTICEIAYLIVKNRPKSLDILFFFSVFFLHGVFISSFAYQLQNTMRATENVSLFREDFKMFECFVYNDCGRNNIQAHGKNKKIIMFIKRKTAKLIYGSVCALCECIECVQVIFLMANRNFRLWKWFRNISTFLWAFSFVGVTLMFEIWFFKKKAASFFHAVIHRC